MKQCEIIGTDETIVSTDTTLTGNGTSGSPLSVAAPGLTAVSTDATLTGSGTVGSPLSVAAPGLTAVSVDSTLTGDGTPGTPLSVVDPSAGGSKLERVDTGAWEPARRSNGVITAVADAGGGVCTVTAAAHGQADGATVTISGTTDYNGDYVIANVTTDTFDITETFTSSQTGTFWVAANVYYSPDQQGGAFGTIKRRRFVGVTGGASVTLEASFHATKRMVGQGGHVIDTASGSTLTLPIYFGEVSHAGVSDNGTNLVLLLGSGFDDANDTYSVHVDYYEP